jgi:hypothetical protein
MPRALYDSCQLPGINPVLITPEVVMPVTRHTKDYVLCFDCEQLMNRKGESWMIPRLLTVDGMFPLHTALANLSPDLADSEMKIYATAKIPQIEGDRVLHFATGLFWKGSVHSWRGDQKDPSIHLGPYSEQIRKFLIGETPYPRNVKLFVTFSPPSVAVMGFAPPYEGNRMATWRNFICDVPGVQFAIAVGQSIPRDLTIYSFSENPVRPVMVWGESARSSRLQNMESFLKAYKTKSFQEQRKRRLQTK